MANHLYFNDQTIYGRKLRNMLQQNEGGQEDMKDLRDVMIQMRENDGSQDADYEDIATKFGFETAAKARSAFLELDSAFSKISGNASVSDVRAAFDQLFSKLR